MNYPHYIEIRDLSDNKLKNPIASSVYNGTNLQKAYYHVTLVSWLRVFIYHISTDDCFVCKIYNTRKMAALALFGPLDNLCIRQNGRQKGHNTSKRSKCGVAIEQLYQQ